MKPTHLILEGDLAGSHCTFLRTDRDGILVDVCGMLRTYHPSALQPLSLTHPSPLLS